MTQEEKDLLLKDLCARLSYGVMMKGVNEDFELSTSAPPKRLSYVLNSADFKPYLRPMSSMTDEEDARRCAFLDDIEGGIENAILNYIDWLISNHFDYRGLIQTGLALPAKKDMYK